MYGLIISMFIIPWKCFLMSTDSIIIRQYIGVDMECLLLSFTNSLMVISSIIYNGGAALIRCWFVRSSLQMRIQDDFRKDKYLNLCRFFPQVFIVIHICNTVFFVHQNGLKNYPLMLFKACVDPWSHHTLNGLKLMPLDQLLFYCYAFILIYSNFYLYRFLHRQNKNNSAKKPIDMIRDRKRNFVTARTGFIAVFLLALSTIVFHVVYNFEYWTFEKYSLDTGTKAFIFALYGDTFDCIINPCVLLSGAPAVRKAILRFRMSKKLTFITNVITKN